MLIIVTDEGEFWNHRNPLLERYADSVLVVCLGGKKVTDQYRCFVPPYPGFRGRGMPDNGLSGEKFRALASVAEELDQLCRDHEQLLFLTDSRPQSLLPYLALKGRNRVTRTFHLWCMTPARFEGKRINREYFDLFTQVTGMNSLFHLDHETIQRFTSAKTTLLTYFETRKRLCEELLPNVLYAVELELSAPYHYYFDFGLHRYLKVEDPLQSIRNDWAASPEEIAEFKPNTTSLFGESLLWIINCRKSPKELIETPHSRLNGKKICEQLKAMRKALAHANGLTLDIPDCPSSGPCAGTCPQCDAELCELQQLLQAIPEAERVYPQFEIRDIPAMPVYNEMTGLLRCKEPPESDATKGANDHE